MMDAATAFRAAKRPVDGHGIEAHVMMAKALRREVGESYALAPFAPMLHEDRWWIAATFGPIDGDADVMLIDGKTGAMRWFDEPAAQGFWGDAAPVGKLRVYSNGILLARDWAERRARVIAKWREAKEPGDTTLAHMPGLAMIGDPARMVNFSDIATADSIEIDNPRLRHVLADAMLRAARLPVVTVAPARLRVAA